MPLINMKLDNSMTNPMEGNLYVYGLCISLTENKSKRWG